MSDITVDFTTTTIACELVTPTVTNPEWANVQNKPTTFTPAAHTQTVSTISDFPTLATVATSGSYNDLSDQPSIPAAQVNSDWNASTGVAQILNKPTIPTNTVSSTQIENIVVLTQAEYDALTPDEGTLYIIVAGD